MTPTRGIPVWKLLVAASVAMATAPMALAYAATDENDAASVDVRVSTVVERTAKDLREEGKRQLRAATARAEQRAQARRQAERRAAARARAARARRQAAKAVQAVSPVLEAIAACESGGNPGAIGGGGAYRGKYQFDYATWASVGGSGDPAAAPEAEQDSRAAALYARTGGSAWPVCAG